MPNVAGVLRQEIARVARKEIRTALAGLHSSASKLRKTAAALKTRIAALERDLKRAQAGAAAADRPEAPSADSASPDVRITAKGVRALRRKLRLSQTEFAALVNVSDQTIYNWEKQSGALKLRHKTRASLVEARKLGARDARHALEKKLPPRSRKRRTAR